jgi:hypothetical protein
VTVRTIFAALIALAVLFAPSAVAAEHMAAMPGHDMLMMDMGHCDGPSSKSDHKAAGKSCCISMCMAVAITPEGRASDCGAEQRATYFAQSAWWHGYLGEIATPPPRSA